MQTWSTAQTSWHNQCTGHPLGLVGVMAKDGCHTSLQSGPTVASWLDQKTAQTGLQTPINAILVHSTKIMPQPMHRAPTGVVRIHGKGRLPHQPPVRPHSGSMARPEECTDGPPDKFRKKVGLFGHLTDPINAILVHSTKLMPQPMQRAPIGVGRSHGKGWLPHRPPVRPHSGSMAGPEECTDGPPDTFG